ncbi:MULTISPECIES: ABC transporter ATP-binding protein [Pseudomonas]|uniref:ABC-type dipeptide transporter n=1 Tax=Pseudomonas juntendi TaxID=2666183 RepID=A0A7W2QUG2_9PSED|nr:MULTISPECIES: ABC transporter ATP-binding protein [Pseudomonas]NOY02530.1 ABC transporter ATP-binding protein [Gammaproteobacteria bacterium]OAK59214.1 peptide ABC transporter substrate-binding protein [Pseudomonas putida]PPB17887.1 ABC transporter ATP-binding protein [Pseudomonas aeruginosa]MBA6143247.1 ABC transporter ATP-binding protein [Pseudomonas juntendi]MCL8330884.1 ABC transporter ATP-binding protein [Pseudomonas juntendi]
MSQAILSIDNLNLEFPGFRDTAKALNGVTLRVQPGEIVGVVGESGSGKSVTAMLSLGLLPPGSFRVTQGSVQLLGKDILGQKEKQLGDLRGRDAAMIFQEPMTALNPTRRIGKQLLDVIQRHQQLSNEQAYNKAVGLLQDMHIADPEQVLERYPFELSGGMRQRIMIALAFSCDPKLLIADEPTTALDVTVQRQVLLLLREKARERGTAILLITHDMALVSQFCDRVYVMYTGGIVEQGSTSQVMNNPAHPYTQGLLASLPERATPGEDLDTISGQVPNLAKLPNGCTFKDRCTHRLPVCEAKPKLFSTESANHLSACWLHEQESA